MLPLYYSDMKPLSIKNLQTVAFSQIPSTEDYSEFSALVHELMAIESCHCVNYFAYKKNDALRLIMCIANDDSASIEVFGFSLNDDKLESLQIEACNRFEREIAENFDLSLLNHSWPKPLRTTSDDYPFYRDEDEEIHEVGVGPIHAGIIEPGHFRFTCKGEKILNLEIMLGYQHRGVEKLMVEKLMLSQKAMLAESVAADSAVSNSVAFAGVWESLCGFTARKELLYARTLACELERIAIHTGDLSAICGDVAYQLGNAVYGRLRTPVINFIQKWCGNRLGKTAVRPFETPYPFTLELVTDLRVILAAFEKDFVEMSQKIRRFPSVLSRLERTGIVTTEQAEAIGAVGMAGRASGIYRDIRRSHPYLLYQAGNTVVKHHGDVYARTQIRMEEVVASIGIIRSLLDSWPYNEYSHAKENYSPAADSFALGLVEGWRGEACHVAITDEAGRLALYKYKDPSFHNWTALELAVRNNEISDFPICNKSFNLSYCGHDL